MTNNRKTDEVYAHFYHIVREVESKKRGWGSRWGEYKASASGFVNMAIPFNVDGLRLSEVFLVSFAMPTKI